LSQKIEQLENGERFSLSTDEWTSLKNRRFAGLNLHGKKVRLLGMIRIKGSMTSERGKEIIQRKLSEFGLDLTKHIVATVTDGAAVMRKMGELMDVEHQICNAHGLHLAVIDVLYKKKSAFSMEESASEESDEEDEVEGSTQVAEDMELQEDFGIIINKIRKVVKTFKRSPLKNDLLERLCEEEKQKKLVMILDTRTRWNSMLAMVKRFLEMKEVVKKALIELDNEDDFPSHSECEALSDVVEALDIIESGTKELSKDSSSLHTADLVFEYMLHKLEGLSSPIGHELFLSVKKRILERRKVTLSGLLGMLEEAAGYKDTREESKFLSYPHHSDVTNLATV
jgi:hypothetical protein